MRGRLRLLVPALVLVGCAENYVLSGYGSWLSGTERPDDRTYWRGRLHTGVDIRADIDDPVIASADGVVTRVQFGDLAGGVVTVYHRRFDRWTRYVHLKTTTVKKGDRVGRGDLLGTVGLFPYSGKASHVHLELCSRGCDVERGEKGSGDTEDPMKYKAGCFKRGKDYPTDTLVLTYPIRC